MSSKYGRKFILSVVSIIAMLIAFAVIPASPVLATGYNELVTGILGILIIYCGGNVSNKFILNKKEDNNGVD